MSIDETLTVASPSTKVEDFFTSARLESAGFYPGTRVRILTMCGWDDIYTVGELLEHIRDGRMTRRTMLHLPAIGKKTIEVFVSVLKLGGFTVDSVFEN